MTHNRNAPLGPLLGTQFWDPTSGPLLDTYPWDHTLDPALGPNIWSQPWKKNIMMIKYVLNLYFIYFVLGYLEKIVKYCCLMFTQKIIMNKTWLL